MNIYTVCSYIYIQQLAQNANIFMDRLEQKLLSEVQIKPHLWFRYIDDIFMVWLGSESELEDFLSYINAAHEVYMELVKRMGELLGCESQ